MTQAIKRYVPSLTQQIIMVCALFTLAAGVLGGVSEIKDEIKSGRTYSPAVVLGYNTTFSRESSPVLFWSFIGFYEFSGAVSGIVIIVGAIGLIRERRMRNGLLAGRRKVIVDNLLLLMFTMAYLAVLGFVCFLVVRAKQL